MAAVGGGVSGHLRRGAGFFVMLLAAPAVAAAAYCILVIIAAVRWPKPRPKARDLPPVSILKPMYGKNAELYRALRSYAAQDYPAFEILFGVGDPNDPALEDVERLRREFAECPIHVIVAKTRAANAKTGVLAELAKQARYELLLVSDDDIVAAPDYLQAVVAPFDSAHTGLVTCLYRAPGRSFPSLLEGLGIATEFAPSVMVARLLGVVDFALGSTMALRAEVLREAGGFEALGDLLADDYHLGRNVAARGYRIEFASTVVETGTGASSWSAMWRHQLRWSRTIRVSRRGGYYGSGITHATVWALLAMTAGQWGIGITCLGLRIAAALVSGGVVLKDAQVWRWFWFLPVRDLFGFAVWVGGCFGSTVDWRGRKLRLRTDGKISVIAD